MEIVTRQGYSPYAMNDDTRNWVETHRVNGLIKPAFLARVGTDTNYLRTHNLHLYGTGKQRTKSMMNLTLPGQRLPGVLAWSVQESLEDPVQSASMEMLNCLYVSTIETTLQTALPGGPENFHSLCIRKQWASDSLGVVEQINGNTGNLTAVYPTTSYTNINVETVTGDDGYKFREENVKYRMFAHTKIDVLSAAAFPDPSVPDDDDNDIPNSPWFPNSSTGVGSYYIRIDSEIIRVIYKTGNTFYIPPGGRGIGGTTPASHVVGARVQLLGFGPPSGEWTALGYLNIDDASPQSAVLRPGTCLTSYEGYGQLPGLLSHDVDPTMARNYVFTGYWFVSGLEPSMNEDGVPRLTVDLRSAAFMLDKQKITPDLLRRAKTQFGQWRVGGRTIWGAADHDRDIPGDWVDYNSWDPSLPQSYPLAIKTELAQHKEFYDHMIEQKEKLTCEVCRAELREWQRNKPHGATALDEDRAIGKHIYRNSIRVLREHAGPIKTYIRLMATLAMAAWDHPAYGTELSQNFSKVPNELFNNMRNIYTGLVFNGQLDFSSDISEEEWFHPTYSDEDVKFTKGELTCPFEATYDKTPFYQPMVDLADINGNVFWITREGYPTFQPQTYNTRPAGRGWKTLKAWEWYTDRRTSDRPSNFKTDGAVNAPYRLQKPANNGQWFQAYGGSISAFNVNINSESIVTQAWVTATSAFQSKLTVLAGGTGINNSGKVKTFSPLGGNSLGLALTGGVQQVDTVALDNLVLGLDWNTSAAKWGAIEERDDGGFKVISPRPVLSEGNHTTGITDTYAKNHPNEVKKVQRTINFFLVRQYIDPLHVGTKYFGEIAVDGKLNDKTKEGIKQVRIEVSQGSGTLYTRATYNAINAYLDLNKHYIKFDIFWYVHNNRPWEEYLSAITGVPIQETALKGDTAKLGGEEGVAAVIDDIATQKEVKSWTKTFSKMLVNVGNRYVDDSLRKAIVRSISSNFGDPRIQPGDTIWVDIPGMLPMRTQRPFNNGVYVTATTRTMDLNGGTYTSTYSGHRILGSIGWSLGQDTGYGYIQEGDV